MIDVAEVGLAAVVVGQRAVVHDLQQQVEHVRMRLLDLVEQQHAVRMLGDRLGEQAALIEADVARRRADQARDRVPLHVLGHVEAHELDAHGDRELARDLGLADAGRTGEQEAADRLALIAQARARHLDGRRRARSIAVSWPKITSLRLRSRLRSTSRSDVDTLFGGMRAMRATTSSMCSHVDRWLALAVGLEPQPRAGLVDHVDRLVGQVPVVDVPARRARRRRAAPRPHSEMPWCSSKRRLEAA